MSNETWTVDSKPLMDLQELIFNNPTLRKYNSEPIPFILGYGVYKQFYMNHHVRKYKIGKHRKQQPSMIYTHPQNFIKWLDKCRL